VRRCLLYVTMFWPKKHVTSLNYTPLIMNKQVCSFLRTNIYVETISFPIDVRYMNIMIKLRQKMFIFSKLISTRRLYLC